VPKSYKYHILSIFLGIIIITILYLVALGTISDSKNLPPETLYQTLVLEVDKNLGRGLDVFNNEINDRPMAYGLILSSYAREYSSSNKIKRMQKLTKCGEWLLENHDLDDDGISGYGLADSWDAFGDGSINPAHQEYTITTAIVIDGLLDWLEWDANAPKSEIITRIDDLLVPYLSGEFNSPSGLYSYSLNHNDVPFDVFNPAAYLAGQIQRFSHVKSDNQKEKEILQNEADRIISILLKFKRETEDGVWYWGYTADSKKHNDLVHSLYIVEGMRQYIKYDGKLKHEIKFTNVKNIVRNFFIDGHFREVYYKRSVQKDPVRLWALGMLLYFLAEEPMSPVYTESLLKDLNKYNLPDGGFSWKPGTQNKYIRHDAHLLLGLSHYLFKSTDGSFPQ